MWVPSSPKAKHPSRWSFGLNMEHFPRVNHVKAGSLGPRIVLGNSKHLNDNVLLAEQIYGCGSVSPGRSQSPSASCLSCDESFYSNVCSQCDFLLHHRSRSSRTKNCILLPPKLWTNANPSTVPAVLLCQKDVRLTLSRQEMAVGSHLRVSSLGSRGGILFPETASSKSVLLYISTSY